MRAAVVLHGHVDQPAPVAAEEGHRQEEEALRQRAVAAEHGEQRVVVEPVLLHLVVVGLDQLLGRAARPARRRAQQPRTAEQRALGRLAADGRERRPQATGQAGRGVAALLGHAAHLELGEAHRLLVDRGARAAAPHHVGRAAGARHVVAAAAAALGRVGVERAALRGAPLGGRPFGDEAAKALAVPLNRLDELQQRGQRARVQLLAHHRRRGLQRAAHQRDEGLRRAREGARLRLGRAQAQRRCGRAVALGLE